MAINPREHILEQLRTIRLVLQQEFPLRRMALFGSWERNEQTETSDVDILLEVDPSIGLHFVTLTERLESLLEQHVDLGVGQRDQIQSRLNLSMSKRDPGVLLDDIMLALQTIGCYTSQMDHYAFLSDELVIDAVARNLEIIGEAARQLPEEFKRNHAEVARTQLARLRSRIVHDYFRLDLEIIWEIIQHDLPELAKQVRILQS
ncbi:MAG TPA: HepT-like ribonuclease domain-containing protein [Pyrinomonadaceae bacterium]|nr:HepT-like ribonuclease domain-containing protein [Pyrinomonadaceae bacterium]